MIRWLFILIVKALAGSTLRSAAVLVLSTTLVAACGLGMDAQDRLNRGQEAFQNADYRAAVIDARSVLLDEPQNIEARILLGRAAVQLGDGATAEKELRRALELGADFSGFVADLGRALLLQGDYDSIVAEITPEIATTEEVRLAVLRVRGDALIGLRQPEAAREVYEDVLRSNSDDVLAQLGIVNSFIIEQNFAQARETLNQVLTFDDSFVAAWLTSGALSISNGDAERAASDYQRAADLARQNANVGQEMEALSGVSNAALAGRDVDGARQVASRMLEIGENDTRTLLISARLASADRDWPKAQEQLQEVLRRNPDYRPAQLLLGVAHKESGNLSQAEMYLSAVVAAAPNNPDARRLLAETRLQLGAADEARQTLAPIIDAAGADAGSLSIAAQASLSLRDFGDATDLLERGVAADPQNIDLQLQLAFTRFQSGDVEGAQRILRELPVETTDRNEIQRASLMILSQMSQGSVEEALENARSMVARWPDRPESHSLAGSIEMAMGDNPAARKSFNTAASLAPDNLMPVRYLARLDEVDGDTESARKRYLHILESLPGDVQSMVALAKLAALAEDYDDTRDWLEKARTADSRAREPRRILAALLMALKDYQGAEEVAKEALDLDSNDADLYNLLGQAQFNREDFRRAELSFSRATELGQDKPMHRMNLAKTQARQGNTAVAIATLSEPPEKYLEHLPSAILLASLKASSGSADESRQIAAKLRERYPDSAAPYALEAELFARDGDLAAASERYDRAMSIQVSDRYAIRAHQIRSSGGLPDPVAPLVNYLGERPLDNNVRLLLAQSYQVMHEYEKSSTEYEQVLKADPDNFAILNNIAWNYLETGNSRAESIARRAYEIQPDNSSVVDTLGWIMIRNGQLDDGITMLRQAVKLSGDRAEIRYHLAAGLAANGANNDARDILSEILASEESFASRQEAEELLSTL